MRLNNLKRMECFVVAQKKTCISLTESESCFCFLASAITLGIFMDAERGGGQFCLAFHFHSSALNINQPKNSAVGTAANYRFCTGY